jgi:hypothetical protein
MLEASGAGGTSNANLALIINAISVSAKVIGELFHYSSQTASFFGNFNLLLTPPISVPFWPLCNCTTSSLLCTVRVRVRECARARACVCAALARSLALFHQFGQLRSSST